MPGLKQYIPLTCILAGFLFLGTAKAQPSTFIHIQTENNQSYQIQWRGNTYYSSIKGKLVIPLVPVGEHVWVLSFPGTNQPEYSFSVPITDRPRGFTLKYGIDNTWTLFDMASFEVIRAGLVPVVSKPEPQIEKRFIETNPAPNLETKLVPKPEQKLEVKPAIKVISMPIITEKPKEVEARIEKPVIRKVKIFPSNGIQKIFESFTELGVDRVYTIKQIGKTDTVAVFIPFIK